MEKEIPPGGHFLRLPDVLRRYPVCKSVWWAGVEKGIYPAGVKISSNVTAWHSDDIDALISRAKHGDFEGDRA